MLMNVLSSSIQTSSQKFISIFYVRQAPQGHQIKEHSSLYKELKQTTTCLGIRKFIMYAGRRLD